MKPVREAFDLSGRVAVITGGAGLLGVEHAEAIAECGGIPVLLDVNGESAQGQAKRIASEYKTRCLGFGCDVTKKEELERVGDVLVQDFGRVNILINNAAIDPKVKEGPGLESFTRLENLSVEQWNAELAVGLTGAFLCAQVFGSLMAERGGGVILNVGSDLSLIAPDQRLYRKEGLAEDMQPVKPVTYSVIKHGIVGLTKYLATYWADKNIRVNSICPGGVYTNQDKEFLRRLTNLIPLGRMASKDEYRAAIVFLVSDGSSYMTGANLVIDGGRSVW